MTDLVDKTICYKVQWLASVWVGRDRVRLRVGFPEWHKDPLASAFLRREKVRKKRTLEESCAQLLILTRMFYQT